MAEKPKKNKWAGRSTNLTKKQEKKAVRVVGTKGGKTRTEAVKKSERVASRKSVDIGQTKWMKASERKAAGQKGRGGLLVGTDGKPVTGTVTLPSGKKAQYVRGKRISAMPAKKAPASRGGGGGGGGGGGRGTGSQGALSAAERKKLQQGRPNWQSGASRPRAGSPSSAANRWSQGQIDAFNKARGGSNGSGSWPAGTAKGPQVGATKTMGGNRFRWNGRQWVKMSK